MGARRRSGIVGVLLVVACGVAGCGGADDEDTSGAGASTLPVIGAAADLAPCANGRSPALFALDPATGGVQWTHCTDRPVITTALGATDDTAFALEAEATASAARFVAVDAATGKERWGVAVARQQWPAGPMAAQGVVVLVVGTELVGFDARTGNRRWAEPAAGATPIAHTEKLVVVAATTNPTGPNPPSGVVRGVDRTSGRARWSAPLRMEDASGVMVGRSPAAVTADVVVVPRSSELVALDLTNGAVRWTGDALDHPTAAAGVVIGGASDRTVSALDPADGKTLWSTTGRPSYGDLWVLGDGAAYVIDGGIAALDARTGSMRWRRGQTADLGSEPWAAPKGRVIVGWEGVVSSLSAADGSTVWTVHPALVEPGWMTGVVCNDRSVIAAVDHLAPTD